MSPAASAVLLRWSGLEIVDSGGDVIAAAEYFDPVDRVVTALSDAVGSAPVIERYPGGLEQHPGTSYRWDGLKVLDSDQAVQHPSVVDWSVVVDGQLAGDLRVSTAELITVGLTQERVEELAPGVVHVPDDMEYHQHLWGTTEETEVAEPGEESLTHSVAIVLQGPPFSVTGLFAPSPVPGN